MTGTEADGGVQLVGHRGALGVEPENTIRSFERALATGVDVVELDLRVTGDGELVVMHDETVDRTTDGTGEVGELSLADVRALDAGDGQRVPTFTEVLHDVPVELQVEVKEHAAVSPTVRMLRDSGRAAEMTVTSNIPEVLDDFRQAAPELRRGLILLGDAEDAVARASAVDAELLCIRLEHLTPELVAECADAGTQVNAWIVNDAAALLRALELGSDAVSSDVPDLIADLLRRNADGLDGTG